MTEQVETCPFLAAVTLAYCEGSPSRKPIPLDRLSAASRCTGEDYRDCPVYRELRARERGAQGESEGPPAGRAR